MNGAGRLWSGRGIGDAKPSLRAGDLAGMSLATLLPPGAMQLRTTA